jgi:hypothetical protein
LIVEIILSFGLVMAVGFGLNRLLCLSLDIKPNGEPRDYKRFAESIKREMLDDMKRGRR